MILLQVSNNTLFIIVAMLLVMAFFITRLLLLFQKRKIRLLQQQLAKKNYDREILKMQIGIRNQAMNDVGRELLDHISPMMTLIKINMNLLAGKGLDAANEQRLEDTKNRMKKMINDIRMLSNTLNVGDEAGV